MLLRHAVTWLAARALVSAGKSTATSSAMMPITTRSSTRVNARVARKCREVNMSGPSQIEAVHGLWNFGRAVLGSDATIERQARRRPLPAQAASLDREDWRDRICDGGRS